MAVVKDLAWTVVWYMASMAPPTPAKKEEMQKASCLWWARLTPMASAAISSSRMDLKARPYPECSSSTISAMQMPAIRKGTKVDR